MAGNEDKKKALDAAIAKLEKDFGKGTVEPKSSLMTAIRRSISSSDRELKSRVSLRALIKSSFSWGSPAGL